MVVPDHQKAQDRSQTSHLSRNEKSISKSWRQHGMCLTMDHYICNIEASHSSGKCSRETPEQVSSLCTLCYSRTEIGAPNCMCRMYQSVDRDMSIMFVCIGIGARACDRHIPNAPTQTCWHTRDKIAVVAVSLAIVPDSQATLLVVNT